MKWERGMSDITKYIYYVILCLFLTIHITVSGQTPGLIIKPAEGAGAGLLDPDGDGYVSQKTHGVQIGFTIPPNNDVLQSEIPYVALVKPDIQGDLERGPTGGFTEIVGTDEIGNNAILTYTDGINLYYRFRLSGYAPNSKSYSILIDADGKFGFTGDNKDPDAKTGNPGFEYEVVLETNFNVEIYNVNNTATRPATPLALASYDSNCQKSIAVSRAGGDADYFYDFFIPYNKLPFSNTTPLRYVALTSMNPFPAIGNNAVSDVGGVASFTNLDEAFIDLIDAQTPTVPGQEVLDRSDCPAINGPITTNSTSISGTSTEGNGTIIKVYKNGSLTPLGTTTVTGNAWTFSLGAIVLAAGDVITTTATASNEGESLGNCNPRTVLQGNAPPCYVPVATNLTMDSPKKRLAFDFVAPMGYNISDYTFKIYDSSNIEWVGTLTKSGNNYSYYNNGAIKDNNWYVVVSHTSCVPSKTYYCNGTPSATPFITGPVTAGSNVNISGTCGTSALVTLFINDVAQVTATYSGSWTITGLSLAVNDRLYVTSTENGKCTVASSITTVVCSPSVTPVINQNVYARDPFLTGTCGAGAVVTVYQDGATIGPATVSGTTWSKAISSLVGNTTKFYVSSTEPGKCESISNEITVKPVPVPVITGTYCGNTTSVSGYITGTNANIQMYKAGTPAVAIGALTATNVSGNWTVSGLSLLPGDQIYATATLSHGSTANSTTITIGNKTTNPVTINTNPIYEGMTSIAGTGTNGDVITLYVEDAPTIYTASWSGNTWTISGIANYEFYPGAKVYVTATTPSQCESNPSEVKIVQCVVPAIPSYSEQNISYCEGNSGIFTLSSSQTGVIYQLVNASGQPQGLEYVGTGGSITLKTNPLNNPLLDLRVKAYKIGNPSCSVISSVAINFTPQSTAPTVNFTSTNLTASYGDASVNLNFSSKSNTPLANLYAIDYPIATNALGLNDISTQTFTANSGSFSLPIPTNPDKLPIGTYYGTITISSSAGSSCSTVYGFSITINAVGSPPVIVNQYPTICSGNTASLIATATGTVTSYQWQSASSLGGTYTNIPGATSANYKPTLTSTTYYKVIINGSMSSAATTVTVNPLVSGSPTIVGTSTVCAGQNSVNYSVSGISNATSYAWTYSGTGVLISGSGNSIYINFGTNATSGVLSVVGTNSCGSGTVATYTINVTALPTVYAGAGIPICANSTAVDISSGASAINHTSVLWTSSGTAGTITNSTSLNTATYTPSPGDIAAGSVTLTLTATGSCGTATSTKTLTITAAPVATAGGNISTCTGMTTITMAGATATGTYTGTPTWSGGAGLGSWTQTSNNSNPAQATFTPSTASGTFTATLTLAGCSNATSTRTISWGSSSTATFIVSPGSDACINEDVTYTTQSDKSNYIWTVQGTLGTDYSITAGGTGTASNTVTIKWLKSGSRIVSVKYDDNGCTATSGVSTVEVHPLPPIGDFY